MSINTNSYTTHRRQLYILPTRIGWIYGLLLLTLLVAAIRFNHQATYLLTFVLAAIGQVTSLYTHKNLLSLKLSAKAAKNVFCNEQAIFQITIDNPTKSDRHAVWLICDDIKIPFSITNNTQITLDIPIKAQQRGRLKLPKIILSSQFPIGILFSWTKAFTANVSCIVYPEPKSFLPLPEPVNSNSTNSQITNISSKRGTDELSHTRPYREGDQPRDIHWQSYAKHNTLVSRELTSDTIPMTEFNWLQVNKLSLEDKLSQLATWLIDADDKKIEYQLNIPDFVSKKNNGDHHKHECLKALALFDQQNSDNNLEAK